MAILQRYLLDEILQPNFAGGKELAKGYTADATTIAPQVDGTKYQIALLLQSTPLHALEELGKHDEVMPQKSTYFYPEAGDGDGDESVGMIVMRASSGPHLPEGAGAGGCPPQVTGTHRTTGPPGYNSHLTRRSKRCYRQ